MRLNKVAVASKDLIASAKFYTILGFEFEEVEEGAKHIESIPQEGEPALMIDTFDLMEEISGETPKPGNNSSFALEYNTTGEVDEIVKTLISNKFKIVAKPWKAFWGQYYAVVEDPYGYKTDLYVNLP